MRPCKRNKDKGGNGHQAVHHYRCLPCNEADVAHQEKLTIALMVNTMNAKEKELKAEQGEDIGGGNGRNYDGEEDENFRSKDRTEERCCRDCKCWIRRSEQTEEGAE